MKLVKLSIFLFGLFILFSSTALDGKQSVDLIILGPKIVTMNPNRDIYSSGGIAISEGKIVAVGTEEEIENLYEGKIEKLSPHAWIIPGLINTHTHAPMILLRGLGSDQNLIDWLEKSIWPIEKKWAFDPSFIEDGTLLAGWEMVLSGTTTHLNSYFLPNVSANACKALGIRSVCAQGVVDNSPFLQNTSAADLLSKCETFLAKWQNDPLILPAIAPHSLYLCSPTTIKQCLDLAKKYGALLSHKVTIGLGSDGPASNNSLDLFQEMDVGAKLQKVFTKDPTVCPSEVMFSLATIDAAKSMGLENKIGSLEAGKLADLVVLSGDSPSMTPCYDPYAHLVYAIKGHCVDSVLIGGRWVLRNRRLTSLDEKTLLEKARSWQQRITDS